MMHVNGRFPPLATALLLGAALLAPGCRTKPEYTPHTPLKGVERPYEQQPEAPPEREVPAAQTTAPRTSGLEDFAQRVAAALGGTEAPLAVFPAMTPSGSTFLVTELGAGLAEETARLLTASGLAHVTQGARLESELRQWNRGPGFACGPDAAEGLAQWMEFRFAVVGTLSERKDVFAGQRSLELELRCVDLASGTEVARHTHTYAGEETPSMLASFGRRGAWRICDLAGESASLDREIELVAAKLARDFCLTWASELAPTPGVLRVKLLPTVLPRSAGISDRMLAFAKEFHEKLNAARAAGDGEVPRDASTRGGATGGVRIQGKDYDSFDDAAFAYAEMRRAFEGSEAGRLGALLAERLGTGFANNGVLSIELVPDESELERILAAILIDASLADAGAVDPNTVAEIESRGAQVLLESAVRENLDGQYEIQVKVTRIAGKHWSKTLPLALYPWFAPRLEKALAREEGSR